MTRSDSSTEHKDVLSTLLSLFSERTVDAGEKFCLCLVQTKRKEKRWLSLFAGEGPNLCCCTRDSYRLLGAPAQSGLGSVCCTILVKLIAGRWKEAAGWTEAPWRQNTSVRGGNKVWKMSYFARHSHPGLPLCYKPFLICEAFGDTSCVSTHIKKKTCLPSAKRRDSVPAYMPYSKRHLAHEEEDFSVLSSKKMCRGSKRFVICLLIPFIKASITGMHTDFYLIPSHRCA